MNCNENDNEDVSFIANFGNLYQNQQLELFTGNALRFDGSIDIVKKSKSYIKREFKGWIPTIPYDKIYAKHLETAYH